MPRWVLRIYWRSALRSNSFLGRISLELYIRVTSSITPVWGALGYGKNKEPTPPSFLDGSRRYPSSTDRGVTLPRWIAVLLFAPHPRAALRENLSDRMVCLMFSEVGGVPFLTLSCHVSPNLSLYPISHKGLDVC